MEDVTQSHLLRHSMLLIHVLHCSGLSLLLMKKWRDTAAWTRLESLRQTHITSYFTRTD